VEVPEPALQQPVTLIEGKYEILDKMREGGMGSIYRVRHRLLDEIRVVKVLKAEALSNEEMKRRFLEEARTATRLKHPNIGTIHDFALDDEGKAYLVMEYIDGVNLVELLKRQGPPGVPLSLEIAHQTLLALGYLHRKNIVHRDIAPDNLMLTHDEDNLPRVKLIDLGIAKSLDRPGAMTSTGIFLGKLKYASPEQFGSLAVGEKLDGRCDIYALGVVLYELLTGVHPFVGESPSELLRAHLFDPPLAFARTDKEGRIPPELRAALQKAMEKRREDRFASAEDFDRELSALRDRQPGRDKLEDTAKIISRIRGVPPSGAEPTVTPSAQHLLDQQFIAASTPQPSRETLLHSIEQRDRAETEVARGPSTRPGTTQVDTQPLTGPRNWSRWIAAAATAVVILAAGVLLRSGVSSRSAPTSVPAPAAAPRKTTPEPAAPPEATRPPSSAPLLQPTALPEPTAVEAMPASPAPAEPSPRQREEAEQARSRASAARQRAERAGAPERAAALVDVGRGKEKEGRDLLARGEFAAARAAFDAGRDSFKQAEEWVRAHPAERPPPPERIAALPEPTLHKPSPAAAAAVLPTTVPAPVRAPTAVPPPAEAARGGERVTEEDRIRETIHRYERAQSTLDADLYARVYPSIDKARVREAFNQLRSQTLELEIQKIELSPGGATAVVRGLEKRTASPQAGIEQRATNPRLITLEKRGDTWVIVKLQS
jgi:serine/threonine-protein kinase